MYRAHVCITPSLIPTITPSLAPTTIPTVVPSFASTKPPSLRPTLAPVSVCTDFDINYNSNDGTDNLFIPESLTELLSNTTWNKLVPGDPSLTPNIVPSINPSLSSSIAPSLIPSLTKNR